MVACQAADAVAPPARTPVCIFLHIVKRTRAHASPTSYTAFFCAKLARIYSPPAKQGIYQSSAETRPRSGCEIVGNISDSYGFSYLADSCGRGIQFSLFRSFVVHIKSGK